MFNLFSTLHEALKIKLINPLIYRPAYNIDLPGYRKWEGVVARGRDAFSNTHTRHAWGRRVFRHSLIVSFRHAEGGGWTLKFAGSRKRDYPALQRRGFGIFINIPIEGSPCISFLTKGRSFTASLKLPTFL